MCTVETVDLVDPSWHVDVLPRETDSSLNKRVPLILLRHSLMFQLQECSSVLAPYSGIFTGLSCLGYLLIGVEVQKNSC